MVFVGDRGAKQGHDAVAQHLVDGALEAMHGVHHDVQGWVQEPPGLFRVKTLDQLRRAFDVGEEDRDLFALAFQSMAGCENLLGEIPGRIGLGSGKGLCGLYRGGSGVQTLSALGAEFCRWRHCKATGRAGHLQPLATLLAEPGRGTIVMLAMRTLHLQGPLDLSRGAA